MFYFVRVYQFIIIQEESRHLDIFLTKWWQRLPGFGLSKFGGSPEKRNDRFNRESVVEKMRRTSTISVIHGGHVKLPNPKIMHYHFL